MKPLAQLGCMNTCCTALTVRNSTACNYFCISFVLLNLILYLFVLSLIYSVFLLFLLIFHILFHIPFFSFILIFVISFLSFLISFSAIFHIFPYFKIRVISCFCFDRDYGTVLTIIFVIQKVGYIKVKILSETESWQRFFRPREFRKMTTKLSIIASSIICPESFYCMSFTPTYTLHLMQCPIPSYGKRTI